MEMDAMPATPVMPYFAADFASGLLECVHDAGLVRPPKFKTSPDYLVIVVAWGIAFVEYCLAVPANRWGSLVYTTAQLKTIQEVITLVVFAGFSIVYLNEPISWNYAVGFALIAVGAFFVFQKW